jgi:hypothetical protein
MKFGMNMNIEPNHAKMKMFMILKIKSSFRFYITEMQTILMKRLLTVNYDDICLNLHQIINIDLNSIDIKF